MSDKRLLVYNASAGSGKTYTLVQEYLILVLRHRHPGAFRRVLAITFTNKAAGEMKGRVLEELEKMTNPERPSSMAEYISSQLGISRKELADKAAEIRLQMLHGYSDIAIQTIDSFMHQVVRAFARDLDLDPEFEVTTDIDTHIALCLDTMLDRIGSDQDLTGLLEAFSRHLTEEEKRWDIRQHLFDYLKRCIGDEEFTTNSQAFQRWEASDWKTLKNEVEAAVHPFEAELKLSAIRGLELLERQGLEDSDFSYGTIPKALRKMADPDSPLDMGQFVASRLQGMISGEYSWTASKASADIKGRVEAIRTDLQTILEQTFSPSESDLRRYILGRLVLGRWHEFRIFATYLREWQAYLSTNNVLPVSEFQRRVGEVIAESPAPFIYERIGERFFHFMLDEFQDTSTSQWSNLLPLLAGGLDRGFTSLIVGDGKQSIYRWRGANVQQFVNLASEEGIPGSSDAERTVFRERSPKYLESNYRSGRAIVAFNNELFKHLKHFATGHEVVYEASRQKAEKDFDGRVELMPVTGRNKADREPLRDAFLVDRIKAARNDGFEFRDMAILVRGRKTAHAMSQLLQDSDIPFTTHESLLLQSSKDVRVLIDALRLVQSADDELAAVRLMSVKAQDRPDAASWIHSFRKPDSSQYRQVLDGARILKEVVACDRPESLRGMTCFEQLEALSLCLNIGADPMIEALLEAARNQAESGNTAVDDLLDWWEAHKETFSATTSASSDAVLISTIHKSKGLQYPVVFLPLVMPYNGPGTVWAQTPFSEHRLPATYRHSSKDPFPQFEDEANWRKLDELNVFYVASTRAEQRLYISVEIASENGNTLNNAIINVLDNLPMQQEESVYVMGSKTTVSVQRSKSPDRVLPWMTQPWRSKIRLAYQHERYERENQRAEGNRLHALLAEVEDASSLDDALDKHIRDGWAEADERAGLLESLQSLIQFKDARAWFAGSAKIKSEATLLTTGEVLRPDRVMVFDDRVEVVDYKTGEPRKRDQEQVRNYCRVLSDLYALPVKGYLYYTAEPRVEEVPV